MRISPSIAAIALLVLSSVAVAAADLPLSYPPPPFLPILEVPIWTGPYGGGFLGGFVTSQTSSEHGAHQFFLSKGVGDATLATPLLDPESPFGWSRDNPNFTAGGFLGYNYQLGGFVVGAEGDAAVKRATSSGAQTVVGNATYNFTPFSCSSGTGDCIYDTASAARTELFGGHVRTNWDASLRLRAGGLVLPTVLLYATGGVDFASVTSAFSYSATTAYGYENIAGAPAAITHTTVGAGDWNDTRAGWTAGAGIEAAVGACWKIRAEYRYTDLGRFTKTVPLVRTSTDNVNLPNLGPGVATTNFDVSLNSLWLGAAYSF